jgi:hypothetical protein
MQILDTLIETLFVGLPRHAVDAGGRVTLQGVKRRSQGVVQNRLFLGYTGERKRPGFEARFRLRSWPVREAISLPGSSALRLNGSEAQQR